MDIAHNIVDELGGGPPRGSFDSAGASGKEASVMPDLRVDLATSAAAPNAPGRQSPHRPERSSVFESFEPGDAPPHSIDFGALARAVRDQRCLETLDALWREVFALQSWFFVARCGGEVFEDGVRPDVIERNGRRCALVFTDEFGALRHQSGRPTDAERARRDSRPVDGAQSTTNIRDGARGENPPRVPHGYATIEVEVDAAVEVLKRLAGEGVFTAIFNDGIAAFEMAIAPLVEVHASMRAAGLRSLAASHDSGDRARPNDARDSMAARERAPALMETVVLPCPPGQVDLEMLLANASDALRPEGGEAGDGGGVGCAGDGAARQAAIAALLTLDAWWFICNPRKPDEVFVARNGGQPTVLAYTDERQAIVATERHRLVARDGAILLLEMPVRDAVSWIHRFLRHGVERLTFNERSTPVTVSIAELSESWQRMQEHTR